MRKMTEKIRIDKMKTIKQKYYDTMMLQILCC